MARRRKIEGGRSRASPPGDGRRDAPAFHRNNACITARLQELLGERRGNVLEVGSGTGQHALAFARSMANITWWPTDCDRENLISIDGWRRYGETPNLGPAAFLDVTVLPWEPIPPGPPLDTGLAAVIAINVVHIAPWKTAASIIRGAGRYLAADGHLLLYGPFKRDGAHTASSNAAFDAALRARNPAWGVRDITELADCAFDHGLTLTDSRDVPANNMILVFDKSI